MTGKFISHADLERMLESVKERAAVYAPAPDGAGDVALLEWPQAEPISFDYRNFRQPPKAFFLPPNQTLLRLRNGAWEEPAVPDREVLLFGVRPCDARALLCLDRVFLEGDQIDPYYASLRRSATVIAVACDRPASTCFCTSVGGGPADGAGADVLAVALEGGLLLAAVTDKGGQLLESAADFLSEPTAAAAEAAEESTRIARDQIAPVRTEQSADRLREAFEAPLWESTGRKCLGCGTCSFLCPTCHCFDITDDVRGGSGRRVRTWDCCAYPLFTLHGSGHNPRPRPRERRRQRVMHKFRYAVENYGIPFCVGCGRCIRSCPAGMDLRGTLKEVGA